MEMVSGLLSHGADVNARARGGWTPLMVASQSGHVAVVKVLLEHKADVNAVTEKGASALAVARQTNKTDVVEVLEQAGATR